MGDKHVCTSPITLAITLVVAGVYAVCITYPILVLWIHPFLRAQHELRPLILAVDNSSTNFAPTNASSTFNGLSTLRNAMTQQAESSCALGLCEPRTGESHLRTCRGRFGRAVTPGKAVLSGRHGCGLRLAELSLHACNTRTRGGYPLVYC